MTGKRTLIAPEFLERIQFRMAVKAGLAASLGLFFGVGFSQLFDRPDSLVSGLWTVITAIVVVQAYLGGTYLAAWIRFLGTLVGSIIGVFCTILLGSNVITVGISVFGTIAVCSLLHLRDSVRIASISVVVLMVGWGLKPDISPWSFALYRFMDSCLGILIAVIVAHTVWPTQATRKVRLNIVTVLRNIHQLFVAFVDPTQTKKQSERHLACLMRDTVELLRQTRSYLDESKIEIRTRTSMQDWIFLIEHLEDAFDLLMNIKQVRRDSLEKVIDKSLEESTHECIGSMEQAFAELSMTLQERHVIGTPANVVGSLEQLTLVLEEFREKQLAKKLPIEEAENFFIYYYSLKNLAEEVIKIDTKIHKLYQ